MATQCEVNNVVPMLQQQQHAFVSSNAYYGYVPLRLQEGQPPDADSMEVDCDPKQEQKPPQLLDQRQCFVSRKRGFACLDENLVPRFKKFREGDCHWAEEHGLAQMYHESPLLRLSPAADYDMSCKSSVTTGNIKFQPTTLSRSNNARCQELEDMLLLTHGCSSYHHYRQTQLNQTVDIEEAEF